MSQIFIPRFDLGNGRRIDLQLVLPRGRKKCPVVIFSHGNPVHPSGYIYLARAWARAGFATVFPFHPPDGENIRDSRTWNIRAKDLKAVVDRIERIHARLDCKRVAIGGHSHGAHAAALVAGAPLHVPGKPPQNLGDPRIRAFIFVSPPVSRCMGLRSSGWRKISKPHVSVTGTADSHGTRTFRERLELSEKSSSKTKAVVLIRGATHESFINSVYVQLGKQLISVPDRRILTQVARETTRFLRETLLNPSTQGV